MNKKKLLIITILFSFLLVGCVATNKEENENEDKVISYKCQLVEENNDTTYLTKIKINYEEDTITNMEIDKVTERTRHVDSLVTIYEEIAKKVNKVKGLEMTITKIDDYKVKQTLLINYSKFKKDDLDEILDEEYAKRIEFSSNKLSYSEYKNELFRQGYTCEEIEEEIEKDNS
jgi:hypothetical protein